MIRRLLRLFRRHAHGGSLPAVPLRADEMRVQLVPEIIGDIDQQTISAALTPTSQDTVTDVERMLTDIGFYSQVVGDSKRTIICPPSLLHAVRALVEAHELGGVYSVRASPVCDGKLFVLDEQAMEATFRQAAQQGLRRPYR
ncbi:hypothetical protein AB0I27_22330 [Streptomyces sp. NPDC050597]|uniref:hypothetical protein n=1 Tax=Streptomyces sp. NPDC050597 TaxID=3157212 RepID=UPI00343E23AF